MAAPDSPALAAKSVKNSLFSRCTFQPNAIGSFTDPRGRRGELIALQYEIATSLRSLRHAWFPCSILNFFQSCLSSLRSVLQILVLASLWTCDCGIWVLDVRVKDSLPRLSAGRATPGEMFCNSWPRKALRPNLMINTGMKLSVLHELLGTSEHNRIMARLISCILSSKLRNESL